jgi:3-dehydroquinate dehydratase-2
LLWRNRKAALAMSKNVALHQSTSLPCVWVLQGPNLNLLGQRESHLYGTTTLAQLHQQLEALAAKAPNPVTLCCLQTNHEGQLLDWLHEARTQSQGLIINPAGYTHTSVALRDALSAYPHHAIEVHISNLAQREDFRQHSMVSAVVKGTIAGLGVQGYHAALFTLKQWLQP